MTDNMVRFLLGLLIYAICKVVGRKDGSTAGCLISIVQLCGSVVAFYYGFHVCMELLNL